MSTQQPPQPEGRPFYREKRWWLLAIAILVLALTAVLDVDRNLVNAIGVFTILIGGVIAVMNRFPNS